MEALWSLICFAVVALIAYKFFAVIVRSATKTTRKTKASFMGQNPYIRY